MKPLSFIDFLTIAAVWGGAAGMAYIGQDVVITLLCLAAAYYSTKWVVLKHDPAEQK